MHSSGDITIVMALVPFLALLDYVGRAHEIEIHPSSVVRRPSVCGIDYI